MKPSLDRINYRPDQCLDSDDLTQSSRRTRELLELHTARGHGVWGVASGYLCTLDTDTEVAVGPGVAVDARGRVLLNSAVRTFPLPPPFENLRPQVFDLVARYTETPQLGDGCVPRGLPTERAALRWEWAGGLPVADTARLRPSPRVKPGLDVPIARLTTSTERSRARIDTSLRPVAHALVRPKIASGRLLQSTVAASGSFSSWTMNVSTTEAGFVSDSPAYFVTLEAHPFGESADLTGRSGNFGGSSQPPDLLTRMATWQGPFVSIEAKSRDGFTMRVSTIADSKWAVDEDLGPVRNPVPVSWLGVETPNQPFAGTLLWRSFLRTRIGELL